MLSNDLWMQNEALISATNQSFSAVPGPPTSIEVRPLDPLLPSSVVLVDSNRAKFRGRGGDSFVLSPLYCGGEATGWIPTEDFGRSWFSRRGMTLPTAMAASAAAVNPNAGVAGAGVTRNRLVSLLLGRIARAARS